MRQRKGGVFDTCGILVNASDKSRRLQKKISADEVDFSRGPKRITIVTFAHAAELSQKPTAQETTIEGLVEPFAPDAPLTSNVF